MSIDLSDWDKKEKEFIKIESQIKKLQKKKTNLIKGLIELKGGLDK